MIKNSKVWERWEREQIKKNPPDLKSNFNLLQAMYEEAYALKCFPPADPLEGLEVKIKMARITHVSKAS